jgi:hypothetical protein
MGWEKRETHVDGPHTAPASQARSIRIEDDICAKISRVLRAHLEHLVPTVMSTVNPRTIAICRHVILEGELLALEKRGIQHLHGYIP